MKVESPVRQTLRAKAYQAYAVSCIKIADGFLGGGNFDFERLPDVKERAMKFSGHKKYFILRLPQRPGALKEFLGLLGPNDDISRFEYLKKSAKNFGSVLLGIETEDKKNFEILFSKMKKSGFEFTDVTNDEILSDFVI